MPGPCLLGVDNDVGLTGPNQQPDNEGALQGWLVSGLSSPMRSRSRLLRLPDRRIYISISSRCRPLISAASLGRQDTETFRLRKAFGVFTWAPSDTFVR